MKLKCRLKLEEMVEDHGLITMKVYHYLEMWNEFLMKKQMYFV